MWYYFKGTNLNLILFLGTKVYSSPEVFEEKCFFAESSTVWSLGILLYNMVFGDIPFHNKIQICNHKFIVDKPITNGNNSFI